MASNKRWTVTTAGDGSLAELVQQLSETGFRVEQVLDAIGCVTGTATDEVATRLRTLPGVVAVEPEQGIDIGPPDAPVTW